MKKIFILVLMIILFFSFASVSASEITNDTINLNSIENNNPIIESENSIGSMDDVNKLEDSIVNKDSNYYENTSIDNNNINDEILSASSEDVGYKAVIPDTTLNYGSGGLIYVNLDSPSGYVFSPSTYSYDFYLKMYDESGNLIKTSNKYSGTGKGLTTLHWLVDSAEIDKSGNPITRNYRIDLVSSDRVITSGNLFITHSSNYKVKLELSKNIIKKSEGAEITMTVTQYGNLHKYDFYLKAYDSKGNLKINQHYYNANSNEVDTLYYTIKSKELPAETYRIEISGADYIHDSDKLQVLYDTLGYSVSIKDSYIDYGRTNTIKLTVRKDKEDPASYYDFFVNICDSKGNVKLQKSCRGSQWGTLTLDLDTTKLNVGNYTIQIKSVNGAYILDTAKLIVTNSLNYEYLVSVTNTTIEYGADGTLRMRICPAYTGEYSYDYYLKIYDSKNNEVISQRYNKSVSSIGIEDYSFNPMTLNSGVYTIKIIYVNHISLTTNAKLTVKPKPSKSFTVSFDADSAVYKGNNVEVTMDVSYINTNFYDFYLKVYDSKNNEKISQRFKEVVDFHSTPKLYANIGSNLYPGVYTIKLVDTDNNVLDGSKLTIMGVYANAYSVNISDTTIKPVQTGYINMSISPSYSSYYKYDYYLKIFDSNDIEVISERYYSINSDTSQCYLLDYDNLKPGMYTIKIIHNGNNYVKNTAKLIIEPLSYNVYSVDVKDINMHYKSSESIKMYISSAAHGYYKYDFYLKIYDSDNVEKISKRYYSNTSATFRSYKIDGNELGVGKYTIKILNTFDNHVMDSANLIIYDKMPTKIICSDLTTNYNGNKYLIVYLKDQYDNAISGAKISINLHGVKILTTDSNGQVKLLINELTPNEYSATIIFNGNEKYLESSSESKVIVKKLDSTIVSSDITGSYNDGKTISVTLETKDGTPISGATVSIDLNGIKTLTTDDNGQIKYTLNGLIPKTYDVTISFNGTNIYGQASKNVKVTIKKSTPKIIAKAKTFKKSVKTKKYSITLKNNLNKVMKNIKVTIKVNKKTYTAKTNSKGVATFKITKLTKKGTFKSIITYTGNKYYNKVTKTINIKVK